jgi:hypothetical protein
MSHEAADLKELSFIRSTESKNRVFQWMKLFKIIALGQPLDDFEGLEKRPTANRENRVREIEKPTVPLDSLTLILFGHTFGIVGKETVFDPDRHTDFSR